ncbi:DNA-binding transcriptional ArsR family regulator [Saccharothrix saharensis]|uniref:DNA-binding transcriptional ArsR family regulator n=1 Tax=Saccharothrix saharensis TaxID=571190 RepID=A0A543JC73_9PSEU|nr:helix-turn-helix domain-containing protein [Saccharothrix saharensis]TQM80384.1 DNA-binding transcriptional ArsR family regulator [Saccharothrix saharensis]
MTAVDLVQRLAELEQRVAALEGDERDALAGAAAGDSPVSWRVDVTPEHVLSLPDRPRIEVLSALAHPVRVEIVRTLLARGGQPATALQQAARLGSTGQLYHHLKALTASGVVEQDKRGSYRLRQAATVPVLVLLTAASDVAGQLRS